VLPYGVRRPLPCVALGVLSIYLPHSLPIGFTKSSGEPIRLTQNGQTLPVAVDGLPRYAVRAQATGLIDTPVAIADDEQGYIADDLAPSDVRAFVVKVRPELGYRDSVTVAANGALAVTLADGRPVAQTTASEATAARRR